MTMPHLTDTFTDHDRVDVAWYDVLDKNDIPDLPWHQVYIIGDYNCKVPIVMYPNSRDNLPGGGIEIGESLEDTMAREVQEELNMRVIDWQPLGYQVCTRADSDEVSYQFRAYAKLEKIGEFISDPGGSIIGHKLVNLDQMNDNIGYGAIGDRMVANARKYFAR